MTKIFSTVKSLLRRTLSTESNLLIRRRKLIAAGAAAKVLRLSELKLFQKRGTDW